MMAGWIKAKQPGVRVLMMTGKREIDPAVAPHFAAVIVGVAFRESRVKHLGGEDLVVLERALQKTETGGMALNFGNGESLVKLVQMIADREGLGHLLAEGSLRAGKKIGKGAADLAVT